MKIRNLAILGGLMVAAGMATVACSGDDDDDTNPVADGGTKLDSGTTTDAATDAGATSTIPNHATVLGFVELVVQDQFPLQPDLLSYFGPNLQAGHSPSLTDIEECLAFQFGAVLGNGDTYPPPANAGTTSGYQCRESMSQIHASLYIPGPLFTEFISAIVTEGMIKGFTFTNAQTAAVLGLESQIVDADASTADGGVLAFGWQNTIDAGTVSDAGDGGDADAGH